jgi:secreted trypsin-like serine protease
LPLLGGIAAPSVPAAHGTLRAVICRLLIVLLLTLAGAAPAEAVVGGRDVAPDEYPWLASSPGCTGALVAPDRLLTAAHCVHGRLPSAMDWRLGPTVIGHGRAIRVVSIASHPDFDGNAPVSAHDVAVLRVDPPVTDVEPLRVAGPQDSALAQPGSPVRTVGWGATQTAGTPTRPAFAGPSQTPHEGDLATVSFADCDRWYRHAPADPTPIPRGVLCAGAAGIAACVGDSGGPLLARDGAGAWVALGVFSFTQRCGADGDPGAWTDLLSARDFVTAAEPTWAPVPQGRPRITGRARVGAVLRCVAPRWTGPTQEVRYRWAVRGRMPLTPPTARSPEHRVTRTEAGKPLTCAVAASNAGGFAVPPLALPVRVARRA